MGQFVYSEDRSQATVAFPAHKFPYTASVYYQCNVRLCALQDPTCQKVCNIIMIITVTKYSYAYIYLYRKYMTRISCICNYFCLMFNDTMTILESQLRF